MDYYLGVDIGGSRIKAALLKNFQATPLKFLTTDTPAGKDKFLVVLSQIVGSISPKSGLAGIGVGLPGIVEPRKGILIKAPNLPFLDGWPAKKFFEKFKTRVRLDNDSRCLLRAEAVCGAGKGHKNIVAVAVGTGIGGAAMIDNRIYCGSNNSAGEFGHMIFRVDGRGEPALDCRWEKLAGKEAFLKQGDRSEIIGIGVANLINVFDPDIIILGGGGVTSGAVNLRKVRVVARKRVISPASRKTPVVPARLGDRASATGAAMLFNV